MASLSECPPKVRDSYGSGADYRILEVHMGDTIITIIFQYPTRDQKFKDTWRLTNNMGWQRTARNITN